MRQRSIKPSEERAHLRVTNGRRRVCEVTNLRLSSKHSFSNTPTVTSTPPRRNISTPRPDTLAKGSMHPTTQRRKPCRTIISAQGGVRPKWAQGSRLTYMVLSGIRRRRFSGTLRTAFTSAWGVPHSRCQPSPMILSSWTITAPTIGLGEADWRPFFANCMQRRIHFSSRRLSAIILNL